VTPKSLQTPLANVFSLQVERTAQLRMGWSEKKKEVVILLLEALCLPGQSPTNGPRQ
jgi:hypothetical protein